MKGSTRYRLTREALRAWLAASGRSVRVLGAGRAFESAAILYLCQPCRLLDPLIMVGACRGPLTCVTDCAPRNRWQKLCTLALNITSCGPEPQAWHSSLRACTEVLVSGGMVLVLESREPAQAEGDRSHRALALACEAWASAFPGKPPVVLPVQRFYPSTRRQDTMVHIGGRLRLNDQLDGRGEDAGPLSSRWVHEACCNSVFALDDRALEDLLRDIERVLRDRLRDRWQPRHAWNQNPDGFRLSSCTAESLRKVNQEEPAALVALRDLCEGQHEAHRQWSLARLRAELVRKQLPALRRFLAWTESLAGLPVACYGVLNHLLPGVSLYVFGLAQRDPVAKRKPWLAQTLVVAACYAAQVALVNAALGRAAAGYYALTLPTSGAYLFRYWRLLRSRRDFLPPGLRAESLRGRVATTRKRFFEQLDALLTKSVGMSRPGEDKRRSRTRSRAVAG
jgi:hypothetical protein